MDTQAFYQQVKGVLEEQDLAFLQGALSNGQTEEVKLWKELSTKLSWAIGTSLGLHYGKSSALWKMNLRLARVILGARSPSTRSGGNSTDP